MCRLWCPGSSGVPNAAAVGERGAVRKAMDASDAARLPVFPSACMYMRPWWCRSCATILLRLCYYYYSASQSFLLSAVGFDHQRPFLFFLSFLREDLKTDCCECLVCRAKDREEPERETKQESAST